MKLASFFILCCLRLSALSQGGVLTLVEAKTSRYLITTDEKAKDEEVRAASILHSFINRGTGVALLFAKGDNFEYCINIKQDSLLPPNSFYIFNRNNSIFIRGGKENGTVNGAWYFLNRYFGIELIAINVYSVPQKENVIIGLPVSIRQAPSFDTRTIYSVEGFDTDYKEIHGLQTFFFKHESFAHSFYEDFLPPSAYFKTHPEYFILYNGKRDSSQPDLLNKDVFNIVLNKIREKIKRDIAGEYTFYSVSLNDNPLISQDAETANMLTRKDMNYTDVLLQFVNRIADSIPNRIITTLAYEQTKAFPKSVKPQKNVTIILTNADNNKSKPMSSDDYDHIQRLHMKEQIPQWLSLDSGLIFWDYIANFSHPLMPWPILFTIKPNLQLYKKFGIRHLFIQNAGRFPSENSELKTYLCANLMWNINYDTDSLIQNFCKKYYQNSWKSMYNYISDINRIAFTGNDTLFTYDGPSKFANTIFKYANVSKWLNQLKKAEKDAGDEIIRKRILKERVGLDYVLIDISTSLVGWNKHDDKNRLSKKLDQFKIECIEAGVLKLTVFDGSLENFILDVRKRLQL